MHPFTTDVLADCHRQQSRRAAAAWRAGRGPTTPHRFRRAIGTGLEDLGLRLQGRPRRPRPVVRVLA